MYKCIMRTCREGGLLHEERQLSRRKRSIIASGHELSASMAAIAGEGHLLGPIMTVTKALYHVFIP